MAVILLRAGHGKRCNTTQRKQGSPDRLWVPQLEPAGGQGGHQVREAAQLVSPHEAQKPLYLLIDL